jgi:UPF0042 nucleotide-binding protein
MSEQKRLIIVSGLSGSGKTVALHVLEDLDFYCIDNMPVALLKALLEEVTKPGENSENRIAVGVDARNRRQDLAALPDLLTDLQESGVQTDLLFLQANDDVLLQRYSESRRRHPLSDRGTALKSAIARERELLGQVINSADLVIDTSDKSVYELAAVIRERIDPRSVDTLSILIESFGYKHGIPADADFVFDLRCLPNPYWKAELRNCTGKDPAVVAFLESQQDFVQMYADILRFLDTWIPKYQNVSRSYLTVAIGCTGGQHRSVCMAEKLSAALRQSHASVHIRHNELDTPAGTSA